MPRDAAGRRVGAAAPGDAEAEGGAEGGGGQKQGEGAAEAGPGGGAARGAAVEQGAHFGHAGEGEGIVDLAAAALVAHNARLPQEGEVLADGRKPALRAGGEVGHAGFALREALDDPQARGVAQCLENLGPQPQ